MYEEVCEQLTEHDRIDASEIEVEVENGEVTLRAAYARATKAPRDRHRRSSRWRSRRHNTIRLQHEQRWPPDDKREVALRPGARGTLRASPPFTCAVERRISE
jgi:hypothetical protein